jgi:ubiquitin-protein ligase
MSSPRIRRLENDYQALRLRFDGHPFITVEPLGVLPPEQYRVVYRVPSLRLDAQNRPIITQMTVVDFQLPGNYPKEKPRAVASEQVFHPNFGEYVCIADFWSPAQSLVDIILEVGEMLQWQKYNILSPLDAVAADWAVKQRENLPVGRIDLYTTSSAPTVRVTEIQE